MKMFGCFLQPTKKRSVQVQKVREFLEFLKIRHLHCLKTLATNYPVMECTIPTEGKL